MTRHLHHPVTLGAVVSYGTNAVLLAVTLFVTCGGVVLH